MEAAEWRVGEDPRPNLRTFHLLVTLGHHGNSGRYDNEGRISEEHVQGSQRDQWSHGDHHLDRRNRDRGHYLGDRI